MDTIDVNDEREIANLLSRFFLAFDQRDWEAMISTLADHIFVDYASSGREAPTNMPGSAFVDRRRGAVDTLSKMHSFSNLLLSRDGEGVRGRCNYLILRFANTQPHEGGDFYHSCGSYVFGFAKSGESWRINSITQQVLRSWGNSRLHGSRFV